MAQTHKPTDEQQAILSATSGKDSLIINAFAGCAKTTTLEMAAPSIKVPALSLQFNKKIAVEAEKRFPGNFSVKTLNGMGHGAWLRALPTAKVTLDDRKLGKLITQIGKDRKIDLDSEQWISCQQLVSRAMQNGIVPISSGDSGFLPDNHESWAYCASQINMLADDFEFLYEIAHEVLEQDIALARQGTISFDDQVYCSVMLGGKFPKFPVVFVDEAQDLTPLNHKMVELCLRDDGRLFVVGDEKQAIYAFRGASGQSMHLLSMLRNNWTRLPLATTFRCPKSVVARHQEHAPGFRAFHTNAEGQVAKLGSMLPAGDGEELEEVWFWPQVMAKLPKPDASIAILCRNNAPLLSMAFKLIRQGIGPVMLGRDIGKGLVSLSRKIAKDDAVPADLLRGLIESWQESERSKAVANNQSTASIDDRAECLLAVLGEGVKDAGQLRAALTKLFSRESGLVMLGSIHRAKGLEWDTVVYLDPWRTRKAAASAKARRDEVQFQQELNLGYVAETRTKHTLLLADLAGFR